MVKTICCILWHEICGGLLDARYPSEAACQVPAALVTDSRNLFDKIQRPTVCVKGAEKRSDIEAIALRENLEMTQTPMNWAHGGAMLSNSLTKPLEKNQFWNYVQFGFRYKIVHDERFRSEKVRRKEGVTAFEDS